MEIPLKYTLTQEMVRLISQIEAKKTLLENIRVSPKLLNNFQRQSLLKSSLYSAKIEGNPLEEKDLQGLSRKSKYPKERMEIENIISGFNFLREKKTGEINIKLVLNLHRIVMKNLSSAAGKLRIEPSAVYNQSGFPVYIPPPPSEINGLLEKLLHYLNIKDDQNPLIKASMAHLCFEKIHPFLDGNGRTGRLLYQLILIKNNYHFNWLLSLEEEINTRKEEYYVYLDRNDAVSFIEFNLEILLNSADNVLKLFSQRSYAREELLLPRRKEILDLIREHKLMSLNSIKRRFLKISPRMIRYDLKKLEEEGYIFKVGSTRGALYKPK